MMGYGMQAFPGGFPGYGTNPMQNQMQAGQAAQAAMMPGQAPTAQAQAMPQGFMASAQASPVPAAQAPQGVPAQAPQATPQDQGSTSEGLTVSGCQHETVGVIANGDYTKVSENHGKGVYKKDQQVNGMDILMYYWDERDGPNFCGWYFGPKVGGDQVWAHHPSRDDKPPAGGSAETGPSGGWCVPFGGPVDPAFRITPRTAAAQQQATPQAGQAQGVTTQAGLQQGALPQGGLLGGLQQQQAQQMPGLAPQQSQQSQLAAQLAAQLGVSPQLQQQQLMQQQLMQQLMMNPQLQAMQLMQQQQQAAQQLIQQQQLQELARRKEEENKRRQELMKQRQEENQKKIEEMRKKMAAEQAACHAITRVIQRVKVSTPETYEDMKKELEKVLEEDGAKCGSLQVRMKAESEKALVMAKASVDKITEHRRIMAERKAAEEKLRKEIQEKTTKLLEELNTLIDAAQTQCKKCRENAQPLVEGGRSLPDEQVESAISGVETSCTEAEEMTKKCTAFILERGPELKSLGPGSHLAVHGQPSEIHQVLAKLLQQIKELAVISQQVQQIARTSDGRLKKRKIARAAVRSIEEIFEKYDKDGDGVFSRSDAADYAKGEFGLDLPEETIDFVWRHNVDEDEEVGLRKENFRWLEIAVGIAREYGRDLAKQRERDARDKKIEDLKVELQERMKEAAQVVTNSEPHIGTMEKKVETLQKSHKGITSEEMVRIADEADEAILEGKSAASTARQALLALLEDVPENCKSAIQEFLAVELKLTEAKMGRIEMRMDRVNNLSKRWRQSAAEKVAAAEALNTALEKDDLEELRAAVRRAEAASCDQAQVQQAREELARRDAEQAAKIAAEAAARRAAAEAAAAKAAEARESARLAAEDKVAEPVAATEDAAAKQAEEQEPAPASAATSEEAAEAPQQAAEKAIAETAPAASSESAPGAAPEAMEVDTPPTLSEEPAANAVQAVPSQPSAAVVVLPPAGRGNQASPQVVAPPPGVPAPPPAVRPTMNPAAAMPNVAAGAALFLQRAAAAAASAGVGQAKQLMGPPGDSSMEASWALFNQEVQGINTDGGKS